MSESCDLGALVGAEEAREEAEEDLHRHHRLPQDPRPEHSLWLQLKAFHSPTFADGNTSAENTVRNREP